MAEWQKNAIPIGGDQSQFPPYTNEGRDAQIEALRYAFLEMAGALHEAGVLDTAVLAGRLGNTVWLHTDKPRTQETVLHLADALGFLRAKLGEPGLAQQKTDEPHTL